MTRAPSKAPANAPAAGKIKATAKNTTGKAADAKTAARTGKAALGAERPAVKVAKAPPGTTAPDRATFKRRFLEPLMGHAISPPPIWLMRQAGRYLPEYRATRAEAGSFLQLCYNPALATEVTLQPIRRYGLDAAILFSDILVVPDALGQEVRFVEGEGPRLDPIRLAADLKRLKDRKSVV
jgi:hypothetical protein